VRERSELLSSASPPPSQSPSVPRDGLAPLMQTRAGVLATAFPAALRRGAPGGLSSPIELHSHDLLHYAGDMLSGHHDSDATCFASYV
jgi:hypothetical protein